MNKPISPRLRAIIDALPIAPGMRVLEIGCGPAAAAREISRGVGEHGFVLGIDRSATAIRQAVDGSSAEIAAGRLAFRCVAAEDFVLAPDEQPYHLALAVRVGALDGRHPQLERRARERIFTALAPGGRFYIDGGDPLVELKRTRA